MAVTTCHEAEETLRPIDPNTLREMVYQPAHSHISLCLLTSQTGDYACIRGEDTRGREDGLEVAQPASLLARSVWLLVDLHRRLGT